MDLNMYAIKHIITIIQFENSPVFIEVVFDL